MDNPAAAENDSRTASTENALSTLFPLPLSAFEKYALWDETPECPMSFFVELHFDSPVNVMVLQSAIQSSLSNHPLLACRVAEQGGELVWQFDPKLCPAIRDLATHSVMPGGRPASFDLYQESGMRLWYQQSDEGRARLTVQTHHALCDGVGAQKIMAEVMQHYSSHFAHDGMRPKRRQLGRIDVQSLKQRSNFSEAFGGMKAAKISDWQRLKNAHYFHFQPPVTLERQSVPKDLEASNDPLSKCDLDRSISSGILNRCRESGMSLNDLALALLFLACREWNGRTCSIRPSQRLRVLMPYDLRTRSDLRMPATNRLSYAFLGRTYHQCENFPNLLTSVQAETIRIKQTLLPIDFINGLEAASRYPRLMRWILRRSSTMATVVLTYVGDATRALNRYFPEKDGARHVGDTQLTKIIGAPPVRRNTNVSLGLSINKQQICITGAWNPSSFSSVDCDNFLQVYSRLWQQWESNELS